jgi:sarcosine oxidase subunit delta
MRLTCPLCGTRDRREFTYYGHETFLDRPAADAPQEDWHAYIHLRDNPAGETRDLWYHDPCQSWLVVTRDTVTHAVHGAELAADAGTARKPGAER